MRRKQTPRTDLISAILLNIGCALISCKLVKLFERVTDNGSSEVTNVERLCNVGR